MAPRQFALSTDTGKSDDSAYSRNDVHNALAKSADTAEMGGHPPRVGRSSVVGLHGSSARLTEIVPSGKQRSCEGLWIRMQVHALAGQQSTCRCNSLRGRMLRIRAAVHTLTPLCAQTSGGTPAATLRPSLPRPLVRIGRPLRPAAYFVLLFVDDWACCMQPRAQCRACSSLTCACLSHKGGLWHCLSVASGKHTTLRLLVRGRC